ncbi:hypothetical protein SKAU_G00121630 [Synaphobranchus kaupii]|uniref:Uncharacterized protein n=1 Tax=Synaphobranchus kaupii TaxID=118154 RepID=A0A9Q1J0B6_SYNKA|nr:hypothetical protein SKAU_G00121630 [Synaphobranchus kaupii]
MGAAVSNGVSPRRSVTVHGAADGRPRPAAVLCCAVLRNVFLDFTLSAVFSFVKYFLHSSTAILFRSSCTPWMKPQEMFKPGWWSGNGEISGFKEEDRAEGGEDKRD